MPYPFRLPDLGYPYNALEPHIDTLTMEIHHTRHHQAYVNNLNAALEKHPRFHSLGVEDLLRTLSDLPAEIQIPVRNNGGGHLNHTLFWQWMTPGGRHEPGGALRDALVAAFGSVDAFREQFTQAALGRFGSGWAWLVVDRTGALKVYSTANQDSPVMDGDTPILGVDVWEHAYYLKYQNRRADYVKAWWNVVNWDVVEQFYSRARAR
ncbi:MAG: superoxide dismutase [Armatimonadota bacterium]|nr:superoxide dismutase [Armatimonadota bacterium]MDR7437280.1 superoxide dismutase [Armatimonadota bacterium]MDR7471501.1 superoxide dismutase [Armatimonadota bacterium]MDR7506548.1 superoxide dismutase [Armatimonadota bacterium]MDR7582020.1 superoxide dismutase [Armatimonadota bacterium]